MADARGSDGRIRLDILGGFLGSGKTTWLRHQLHEGLMRDALVIVNEAAATPVDDALLMQSSRIEVLAGGCACCAGRAALVTLLRRLCDERVSTAEASRRVDRIVLETSGLADPGAIADAIRTDPVLQHHIVVRDIVVAVDGLHGLDQLRGEALGRRQAETADRIVVTKVDAAGPAALATLLATLRVLNPGAALSAAVMGEVVPVPDFSVAAAADLPMLAEGARGPITATTLQIDETIDWAAFTLWLSALLHARGDDIVRVKGVMRAPSGRLLLQGVRRVVQAPEMLPETDGPADGDNTLVVIGRGFDPAHLMPSLRRFAARTP